MRAFRVWWLYDDPGITDDDATFAFQLRVRADAAAAEAAAALRVPIRHARQGVRVVVREEEMPRVVIRNGVPRRDAMVILGWDTLPTDISSRTN
jgi:hypothetical protein